MPISIDPAARVLAMFLLLKRKNSIRENSRCCKMSLGMVFNINRAGPAGLRSTKAGAHGLFDPDNAGCSTDRLVSCGKKMLTLTNSVTTPACSWVCFIFFVFLILLHLRYRCCWSLLSLRKKHASKDSLFWYEPFYDPVGTHLSHVSREHAVPQIIVLRFDTFRDLFFAFPVYNKS